MSGAGAGFGTPRPGLAPLGPDARAVEERLQHPLAAQQLPVTVHHGVERLPERAEVGATAVLRDVREQLRMLLAQTGVERCVATTGVVVDARLHDAPAIHG